MFLYLKLQAMNPSTPLAVLRLFLGLVFPLEGFGDDDSQIPLLICCQQLLIGHVLVALHVIVSDVHHRTIINIEIQLPLGCQVYKFIDIFL